MKKYLLSFFFQLYLVITVNAQSWSAVGAGVNESQRDLITYGAKALCPYNGVLYVGGDFDTAGNMPANCIAAWNGTGWDSLQHGFTSRLNNTGFIGVNSIVAYNNAIYAAGGFDYAGSDSANNIAYWDGSSWNKLGNGTNGRVYSLLDYNGALCVGGSFYNAGGADNNSIAQWNGASWSGIGWGVIDAPYEPGEIFGLATYNSNLIGGGLFDSAGNVAAEDIASWNGASWSELANGAGITSPYDYILCALSFNGNLYVGGYFDSIGGVAARNIAMWNGTAWSALSSGTDNEVKALVVYNGNLYAGGYFINAGGNTVNCVAKWDGLNWSGLDSGVRVNPAINFEPFVNCLAVYNGNLYAGGVFDTAGQVPARNIAVWSTEAGIDQLPATNTQLFIYPNPSTGLVTITSTKNISNITVTNLIGQIILAQPAPLSTGEGLGVRQIDLSRYPNGMYFITVTTGNETEMQKIILDK